jgi:ABC-type transport system involved in multi-copper enzyme maturation permease subunit
VNGVWTLARYTITECARRRIFIVVPIVSIAFLVLYWLGIHFAFETVSGVTRQDGGVVDQRALVGATLVGLALFAELFFGAVLAVFLTFNTVRGDAETGLLQTIVVRPVGRSSVLLGRFLGAGILCGSYVLVMYLVTVLLTGLTGDWWPSPFLLPGLALVGAVLVITVLTILGSVYLNAIPNGIVVLMLYLAGLIGGLLRQIGQALDLTKLSTTGKIMGYVVPFEALYQSGLNYLTSSLSGFSRVIVQLGPFGGAQAGGIALWAYGLGYVILLGLAALRAFERRDL